MANLRVCCQLEHACSTPGTGSINLDGSLRTGPHDPNAIPEMISIEERRDDDIGGGDDIQIVYRWTYKANRQPTGDKIPSKCKHSLISIWFLRVSGEGRVGEGCRNIIKRWQTYPLVVIRRTSTEMSHNKTWLSRWIYWCELSSFVSPFHFVRCYFQITWYHSYVILVLCSSLYTYTRLNFITEVETFYLDLAAL